MPDQVERRAASEENHRRPAARALLSGTRKRHAAVCNGNEQARANGYRGGGVRAMIRKVRQHINQNEPLLFERSSPGKTGYQLPELDVPAVDAAQALGRREHARRNRGFPGSQRSGSHPPLHAAVHAQLRHRSGPLSAGLLHHEVQPARQRAGGAHRRPGVGASLSAGVALAGNPGSDGYARKDAGRDHRHGRGHAAAGRRRAWRVHRHPAGPRAARIARQSAQEAADSGFGARHQSGYRPPWPATRSRTSSPTSAGWWTSKSSPKR